MNELTNPTKTQSAIKKRAKNNVKLKQQHRNKKLAAKRQLKQLRKALNV